MRHFHQFEYLIGIFLWAGATIYQQIINDSQDTSLLSSTVGNSSEYKTAPDPLERNIQWDEIVDFPEDIHQQTYLDPSSDIDQSDNESMSSLEDGEIEDDENFQHNDDDSDTYRKKVLDQIMFSEANLSVRDVFTMIQALRLRFY